MTPTVLILLVFGAAAALTLGVTPAVRGLARRLGMVAAPSADRWHERPTALLGGVGIYIGWVGAGVVAIGLGRYADFFDVPAVPDPALGIILAATLMFVSGLLDDFIGFKPASKLVLQVLAASVAISLGVVYPLTPWELVNVVVTIFWFLAVTNALNLLDNMDGVAAGVAGIAGLFLAITFALEGRWLLAAACAGMAGAAAGFLPYNFSRASIFMGDSGSLFLGSLLAGLGAVFPTPASTSIVSVLFVPALIVIIPILDTSLVTVTRILSGRPVSSGGRDHTAHRLVAMGLSERQVALLLYAFAATGGIIALLLGRGPVDYALLAGGGFVVALSVLAAYLALRQGQQNLPHSRGNGGPVAVLVTDLLYKRRALEMVLDLLLFGFAYYLAYLLRFDTPLPDPQAELLIQTLAIAIAIKAAAFGLAGVYRGAWQHLSLEDVHRLLGATALGGLMTFATVVLVYREAEFSRSVFILDTLLVAALTIGVRASFRSLDGVQRQLRKHGARTLIYGAGRGGELLVRELRANPELGMLPIGFIDDDTNKVGTRLHGLPVLGTGEVMEELLEKKGVSSVILSSAKIEPETRDRVREACARRGAAVSQLRIRIEGLEGDGGDPAERVPVPSYQPTQ